MSPSAAQLAAIDAELDAFGKSDAELDAVRARARADAAALAGDEALAELLGGLDAALARARGPARPARPARRARSARPATSRTSVGAPAAPDADLPVGSGLVEIPEEELRRAELPPVLDLADADAAATARAPREEAPLATSDISGLSVDDLFADAEEGAASGAEDLAALFGAEEAEEEAVRLSDPDLDLESLEQEDLPPAPPPRAIPPPRTMPPPLPARAAASRMPPPMPAARGPMPSAPPMPTARAPMPAAPPMPTAPAPHAAPPIELDSEDEETADETIVGSLAEVLAGARSHDDDDDDDFDLLVDDEVLELGADADGTEPPADEPGTERRGGIISRILGRK